MYVYIFILIYLYVFMNIYVFTCIYTADGGDRTENIYDCQNFQQVFTGVPVYIELVVTGIPKISNQFSRVLNGVPPRHSQDVSGKLIKYIYIYQCIYINIHICVYICTYIYVHICIYICMYIYAYLYIYMDIHI